MSELSLSGLLKRSNYHKVDWRGGLQGQPGLPRYLITDDALGFLCFTSFSDSLRKDPSFGDI